MKALTTKEQKFAELCVELGNQTEAYRQAYDVTNNDAEWLRVKASQLASKDNISLTIENLRKELKQRHNITKDDIIAGHRKIIEAWEELWELGGKTKLTKDERDRFYLLRELVKGSDYRGAWAEITKLTGLYEAEKHDHRVQQVSIEIKRNSE